MVQNESPAGGGFGAKALSLSSFYRVETNAKGAALKGRMVTATIDFTPKGFARVLTNDPTADLHNPARFVRWRIGQPSVEYPFSAQLTGFSGRVVLSCKVGTAGVLAPCSTTEESPKGLGFGAAAKHVGDGMRVSSKTLDGEDSEGLTVEVVVVSNPSCLNEPEWDRRLDGCPADAQPYQVLPGH